MKTSKRQILADVLHELKPVEIMRGWVAREKLYARLDDLDLWRRLEADHGSKDALIEEINSLHWLLGGEMETIPREDC